MERSTLDWPQCSPRLLPFVYIEHCINQIPITIATTIKTAIATTIAKTIPIRIATTEIAILKTFVLNCFQKTTINNTSSAGPIGYCKTSLRLTVVVLIALATAFNCPPNSSPSFIIPTHLNQLRTTAPPLPAKSNIKMGSCLGRTITFSVETCTTAMSCLGEEAMEDQEVELMSNCSEKCKENFIFRIIKFKRKQKHAQFIEKFWERQNHRYDKLSSRTCSECFSEIQLQNLDVSNLLNSTESAKESVMYWKHAGGGNSSRASSSLDLEWEHEYGHMRQHYNLHALSVQKRLQQQSFITTHSQLDDMSNTGQKSRKNSMNEMTRGNFDLLTNNGNDDASWNYMTNTDEDGDDHLNSIASLCSLPTQAIRGVILIPEKENRLPSRSPKNLIKHTFSRTSSHNSWSHISTPESLEWDIDEDQQRQLRVEDDNLNDETLQLLHQIEQLKNQVLNETGEIGDVVGYESVPSSDVDEPISFPFGSNGHR